MAYCPHCGNDTETSPEAVKKQASEKETISLGYFDVFWAAYPRKTAKKPALAKWKRLNVDQAMFDMVMSALTKQKQSAQWKDSQYVPHASTWLNQERWNDEIPAPTEQQKKMRCTIEGDPAFFDDVKKQWRVKTYAGVWVEYVGREKPVYIPG